MSLEELENGSIISTKGRLSGEFPERSDYLKCESWEGVSMGVKQKGSFSSFLFLSLFLQHGGCYDVHSLRCQIFLPIFCLTVVKEVLDYGKM